jgi:hypothetical protein
MWYSSAMFIELLFTSIMAFAVTAKEPCVPSQDSCASYQCLENQKKCGAQSYIKTFGQPQCQKYLNMQPDVSNSLQIWFRNVRYCLQEKLIDNQKKSCAELEKIGFDSHIECYLQTGFCDLSWADYTTVFRSVGASLFEGSSFTTGVQIEYACLARRH